MFKNHYVLPAHRRKGVFRKLFDFSVRYAALRGVRLVEANCTPMSLAHYLSFGAEVVETYRNVTKVEFAIVPPWGGR